MMLSGLLDGVLSGVGSGVNASDGLSAKLASMTSAAALCTAMGLNVGTNAPTSLYNFVEASLPFVNYISTPTADIDTVVGTGPSAFHVVGASPLTLDYGAQFTDSANGARCSSNTENDAAIQSVACLGLFYIDTPPTATRGFCGKKSGTSAANAGYAIRSHASGNAGALLSDGTTQLSLDAGAAWPTGWCLGMLVADRTAITFKFHSSFTAEQSTALTALLSYTTTGQFRPHDIMAVSGPACKIHLCAVWVGTGAEGIGQTHLNNLKSYLGI